MACPLFLPASPLTSVNSGPASLGDIYDGECANQAGVAISTALLRTCCNSGYARGSCGHAAESDADAFRFLIKENRNGVVDVAWSSERNHHPVAVGTLSLSAPAAAAASGTLDALPLQRQARAYAAAYLRQIGSEQSI
jgi:hypothetical protein